MNNFSLQTINAKNNIIKSFENTHWVILTAQMQSGKTDTFLFTACELIMSGKINNVIIFSGNTETDLKEQLCNRISGNSPFWNMLDKYYRSQLNENLDQLGATGNYSITQILEMHNVESENISDQISYLKNKFKVYWGCDLERKFEKIQKTLYIWEEAHYAQDLKQRPCKFMEYIEMAPNGEECVASQNGCLCLTVSATPFSEISDNLHKFQHKSIVKMEPNEGYVSVKKIRDSGRLRSFVTYKECIDNACSLPQETDQTYWGIIRITNKNEEQIRELVTEKGWDYVLYDSVNPIKEKKEEGERCWKSMKNGNVPNKNTIIFIRGKCRMGQNITKDHILFFIETACKISTDTVLQSLLGRACGYSNGSDKVIIYMHHRILKTNDIDRYITMWENEGIQIMPKYANNIINKKKLSMNSIIPIKIKRVRSKLNDKRKCIIDEVAWAFRHKKYQNKNNISEISELSEKFERLYREDINKIQVCYLEDDPKKTTRNKCQAITLLNAFNNRERVSMGSSGGIASNGEEIKIWVNKGTKNIIKEDDESELADGVCYEHNSFFITSTVTIPIGENINIPFTSEEEIFAHSLENKDVVEANGGYTITLSPETANNETVMLKELKNIIKISLKTKGQRQINSCWDNASETFKGIMVTPSILKSINTGKIHLEILKKFETHLTVEESKIKSSNSSYIRLSAIFW
jgi:hypothetical protein